MKKYRWPVAAAAMALVLVALVGSGASVRGAQAEDEAFSYTRVYNDENGVSHLEDVTVAFRLQNFAPPASPMGVSETGAAESVTFVHGPLGWDGEWHPTPRRQWIVILSGRAQGTVGDGEVRTFGPGHVILLEDTSGRGHLTEVISPEGMTFMAVPLPTE